MQMSTQMFTAGLFIIQIHERVQMAFSGLTVNFKNFNLHKMDNIQK